MLISLWTTGPYVVLYTYIHPLAAAQSPAPKESGHPLDWSSGLGASMKLFQQASYCQVLAVRRFGSEFINWAKNTLKHNGYLIFQGCH